MARRCSTVCLPFDQALYHRQVADPAAFRAALDRLFLAAPELFPDGFAQGYRLKDRRASRKLGGAARRGRRPREPGARNAAGSAVKRRAGGMCGRGPCCTTSGPGTRRPPVPTAAGAARPSG
jgi:hypothetical protein